MDAPKRATKKLTAIRIDPPDLEALAVIANDTGRSVASCIREAIKDWVRARGRKVKRQPKPAAEPLECVQVMDIPVPAPEPALPAKAAAPAEEPAAPGYDPDLGF